MGKDFKNYAEAINYAKEMRSAGFGTYVQEFFDHDGIYYSVLVWEK